VAVSTLVLHFRRETSHPLTFSLMAASVFYSVAAAVIMLLPQALGEVRYWLYAVSLALATLVTLTAFVLHVRYGDASKGLTWTYRAPFVLPAWLVQTTLALQALGTNPALELDVGVVIVVLWSAAVFLATLYLCVRVVKRSLS